VLNRRFENGGFPAVPRGLSKESAELARRGLITRNEACRVLGLSRATVRGMDGIHLTSVTVAGAVYYYRTEVDALISARSGASAQQAFGVFAAGGGPADAVLLHAFPPELADRLWDLYVRLRAKHASMMIIELPPQLSATAWRRAHGYDQITPELVRTALESWARHPELRATVTARCASDDESSKAEV
jgi:hypothetical protein